MSASESLRFELIEEEIKWRGGIITVGTQRFRYPDGTEVVRDRVWHPGAVAILPVDETHVWLVRQPREVIGASDALEIPAGKRDVDGEPPLETAKRELAEEVGLAAEHWEELLDFFPTAGFADEHIHIYVATGLHEAGQVDHPDEDERIEILRWPLAEIDEAIGQCRDAKSLIALMWLARRLDREPARDHGH